MGAYSNSMASDFNGMPITKIHHTFSAPPNFDESVLPTDFPLRPSTLLKS